MFNKILIANRGEIAVRIIRACKEMGIHTVAVFSEPDRTALHTQLADESICIGSANVADSYLNIQNILSAAYLTKSQAIHPGVGFLSENSLFVSMCEECNIKFIGPSSMVMNMLSNKSEARKIMSSLGMPIIPGSKGYIHNIEDVTAIAAKIGYPLMIKAASGGGGRGIRIVRTESELKNAYISAKSEAKVSFGDDSIYIEKLIEHAKHIEVQILADNFGNYVHLGERDCSLQINNQKILEEAPSHIDTEIIRRLRDTSIKCVKKLGYINAGTIEYLYDLSNNEFYFIEMNTRIQVEHPITEMITNIDIVKEQIKIAANEKLIISQPSINFSGHAIECRINAQHPDNNFAPSPGFIDYLFLPSGCLGLRVDSFIYAGYTVPPFYDSMLAKIITHGSNREDAIIKMKRALAELIISGVETNIDFLISILNHENYLSNNFGTSFLKKEFIL